MKRVKVKFIRAKGEESWGILIENIDDIKMLQEQLKISESRIC